MVLLLCLPVLGQHRLVSQTMPSREHSQLQTTAHYYQASLVSLLFLKNLYVILSKGQTTELLLFPSFGLKSCRKQ